MTKFLVIALLARVINILACELVERLAHKLVERLAQVHIYI